MRHFPLFLLFLIISFSGISQVEMHVSCFSADYNTNKKEAGVTVRIYEGATVVASGVTSGNGMLLLKVPTEKMYKIEFSKPGKVTRFATINAKKIDIELLQGASTPDVRIDMTMFDEVPNVDYSYIKSNAITEFYFDGKNPTLAYNTATADKMKKEVERAASAAEKNTGNTEVQFQAKMKEAEALATAKKYSEAATKFEQALIFKPTDKVALKRLDDMDKLVKAEKISQLDGQAANSEFDNLIKAAELLKGQKKYQEAIDKYEEALEKKPKDQNALDEIDALMEIIRKEKKEKENEAAYTAAMTAADGLMKQKSYQAAKDQYIVALKAKPADPVATKKKAEVETLLDAAKGAMEKKKNFDNAVAAGDELFKAEKWTEAKAKYDEALALESASTYVQGQLNAIKGKLDEIEKDKLKKEQITKLIAEGTTAFTAEQFEPAKAKFTEVLKLDPANAVATEKLGLINAKLDELKKNAATEASFKKLVEEGDALAKTAKLPEAVAKYEEAVKLKSDAAVEKKIADAKVEIDKLKNQKETKEKYDLAMKEGEALLTSNKLEEAKIKFTEAKNLDDKAALPKDKLKIIEEKILAEQSSKQKAEKFAEAMTAGEQLLTQGKLAEAKDKFNEAVVIDGTNPLPKEKIKKIDDQLKAEAASKDKTEKYEAAMKAGNDFRTAGKLAEAKAEYVKAKGADATQTAPDVKIKEIDDEIVAQASAKTLKEKTEKYEAAMKAGNDFRAAGKLTEAKAEYVKAKGVDATQTAPDVKIKEIDDEIVAQASAKTLKEKTDKYEAAMKAGNDFRTAGKLTEAKAEYVKAKGVDATQTAPDVKIKEIDDEIVAQASAKTLKEKSDKYEAAMKAGNDLRAAGKLTEAKAEYVKAKGVDATQTAPDVKIKEVEDEMASLADAKSLTEKSDKYEAAMKAGNDLRAAGKLTEAKAEYVKAKGIDATQTAPDVKIKEVDDQIASMADAKSLKEKSDKYEAAMKAGNDLRAAGKLTEAKAEYVKAKGIDAAQTAPDVKIKEVDDQIASMADAKSLKEKSDKYEAAMKAGNDLRAAGKLTEAKAEYVKAKGIDAAQTAPDVKIKEVDDQIASMADAKSLKEKSDKYEAAMKAGNDLRAAGKLTEAKAEYVKAKGIDAAQTAPDVKIQEIENEMGSQAVAQEKKKQVENLLKEGGDLFAQKEYENAKAKYQAVLAIEKDNAEATKKLAEVNTRINEEKGLAQKEADFAALKTKGMDFYSSGKWNEAKQNFNAAKAIKADAEIDAKLKDIDDKLANQGVEEVYNTLMRDALALENGKDYDGAIKKYQEASAKKPAEQKPIEKIKALELLKQQSDLQAGIDKNYKTKMKSGDDAFNAGEYLTAIKFYNEANSIKPAEKEPVEKAKLAEEQSIAKSNQDDMLFEKMLTFAKQKIDERDYAKATELVERAAINRPADPRPKQMKETLDKLIANDKKYTAKINEAEAAVKLKEFDKAITLFTEAKQLKPEESTPDMRIADINKVKASAQNAAQTEELYQNAIKSGDEAVLARDYPKAIAAYKNALNVKQADKKASDKISEVQQILDNMLNAADQTKKKEEFDALVKAGDNLFKAGNWSEAKQSYEAALGVFPKDAYVNEQIKKATANEKGKSEAEAKYVKLIADADASFNSADYSRAKSLYEKALEVKKEDGYPKGKLQQIEDILHPKIVQTGALPNMGTPSDNSVIEGQALLIRAENERKNRSATQISTGVKEMESIQSAQSTEKGLAIQGTSTGIQEIEKQREINALSDDDSRQNTIQTVRTASTKIEQNKENELVFENAESLDVTSKMNLEKQGMSQNYVVAEGVYAENTGTLKTASQNLENNLVQKGNAVYESSLESQKIMNNASIKVSENSFDDSEARKITETDVRNAQKSVTIVEDERGIAAVEKSQLITAEVEKNNQLKTAYDAEEMKVAAENKETLKISENKINDLTFNANNNNTQSTYETNTKLSNEGTKLDQTYISSDDNRLAAVETLKKGDNEMNEVHRNQFNNLYVKSLSNQENITTEKKRKEGVAEMLTETQQRDHATLVAADKQITMKNTETTMSDENQRLSTKAAMTAEEGKTESIAASKAQKPSENKEIMNKSNAVSNEMDKLAQEKQVQKNYEARKLVEKIESREVVFDDKAANALGGSYPEGVSQESFNQNGTDGLPVAVITRRIVVTKGHGDVYVRKQTMNGITYSKNGEPSTEYIWQKETADGKLTRNY